MKLDKIVAITGASAGIGRATALALAHAGASVVLSGRRHDRLAAIAREVERIGGSAIPVTADVTNDADVQGIVDAALKQFGRLDVMICNAGFGIYGAIDRIDTARMQKLLDVNYLGTYRSIRAALPHFRERRSGQFVIVSSIAGKRGVPYMGAYAATKFAQAGLAECLRPELASAGIDVTTVFPISTETEFFDVMTTESGLVTRPHGPRQTADTVASAIVRAIAKPAPEVFPFRKARGLAILNAVAPALCDRLVKKWGREPIV